MTILIIIGIWLLAIAFLCRFNWAAHRNDPKDYENGND